MADCRPGRHLPGAGRSGKGLHEDFLSPRSVRSIRDPPPVGRELALVFQKWGLDDGKRRPIAACQRQGPEIDVGRLGILIGIEEDPLSRDQSTGRTYFESGAENKSRSLRELSEGF